MKLKVDRVRHLDRNRALYGFIHQCPRKKSSCSRSDVSTSATHGLSHYNGQRYKATCPSLVSLSTRINVTRRRRLADGACGRPWNPVSLIAVHCKAHESTNGGHTRDRLNSMSLTGRLARVLVIIMLLFAAWAFRHW